MKLGYRGSPIIAIVFYHANIVREFASNLVNKELRCVTKAGNVDSEERTTAEKTSRDRHVKNAAKCRAHLGHVTSGSVSYGGFHLGRINANL